MNINFDLTNSNQIFAGKTSGISPSETLTLKPEAADALLAELKAGDMLRAQVVSKDGNTVTMQLPGNLLFDAKLASGIDLDVGKLLTFEVKSTGAALSLSPLFTNLSSDPNVSKALNMAGIPLNERSGEMAQTMMRSGMNVDRASLSGIYKDVYLFSDYPVSDIVDLHKLGVDVNETNLGQMSAYKNLSYKIGEGMSEVLGELSEAVRGLISEGEITKAGELFKDLTNIVSEGSLSSEKTISTGGEVTNEGVNLEEAYFEQSEKASAADSGTENQSAADRALKMLSAFQDETKEDIILSKSNIKNEDNTLVPGAKEYSAPLNEDDRTALYKDLSAFSGTPEDLSGKSFKELFDITKNLFTTALSKGDTNTLLRMLGSDGIKDAVFKALSEEWSISPGDVADKEKVLELYKGLTKQLNLIKQSLESVGLKDSLASGSVTNMSSNLDFLHQINQMYSYIQLPIKLDGGDNAHGDLYVYSNGKKLSDKDGKVTALLHLDMEHLGPVDVYVSMDTSSAASKLSTNFYVADDSILDFLNDHMDELTARLEEKGYSVRAGAVLKGSSEAKENPFSDAADGGGVNGLLSQSKMIKLSQYSFDVRT
ncbi:MAG: flagellar hook-length control protein FliK [Lachnospiraceae bacterium]|nr:flagellar hook-length control protein FliK [Lachnospiraceae bacterium]